MTWITLTKVQSGSLTTKDSTNSDILPGEILVW